MESVESIIENLISSEKREYAKKRIRIDAIINDIERALAANAQISALCLTFALIDKCATFEWEKTNTKKSNKKALIKWVDKQISDMLKKPKLESLTHITADGYDYYGETETCKDKKLFQNLDGEILYKLRCALLHEVSANIDFKSCDPSNEASPNCDPSNEVSPNREMKEFVLSLYHPDQTGGMVSSSGDSEGDKLDIDVSCLVCGCLEWVKQYCSENPSISDTSKDVTHGCACFWCDWTGAY